LGVGSAVALVGGGHGKVRGDLFVQVGFLLFCSKEF